MESMLVVSEVPGGHLDAYRRWADEVRQRRHEVAAAYRDAGFAAVSTWVSPGEHLVVTRAEAPSLETARRRWADGSGPFVTWHRECEERLLGARPLDPGGASADLLAEFVTDDVDPLDLFIAVPVMLKPDQIDEYRATIARGDGLPEAAARVRRWGLARLAIWLQPTSSATWAVYDAAGDLAHMLRDISTSPDESMRSQREFVHRSFGIDLSHDAFAMPIGAWSWTA